MLIYVLDVKDGSILLLILVSLTFLVFIILCISGDLSKQQPIVGVENNIQPDGMIHLHVSHNYFSIYFDAVNVTCSL